MLINGQAIETVSASDRGLQYGDGLFETIAVFASQPLLWSLHMQRLLKGCERLLLPAPDTQLLYEQAMLEMGQQTVGIIKILITRGMGERGYMFPSPIESTVMVSFTTPPIFADHLWDEGIKVVLCKTPLCINPILSGIKHINRLEQVMARNEWQDSSVSEGLMQDQSGCWIEGTFSNVLALKDGVLCTAPVENLAVAGVMREYVLNESKKMGYDILLKKLNLKALLKADAVFMTNSIIGLWPIKYIEQYPLNMNLPTNLMKLTDKVSLKNKKEVVK